MKAYTHYIFSAGAGFYLLSLRGELSLQSALLILWLSYSVNMVIDLAGHSLGRTGRPSRTRLTHSIFTAPVWGGAIGSASFWFLSHLALSQDLPQSLLLWMIMGLLFAFGHLFLDSLTEAGVYYWRRRISITHLAYNNIVLNAGFVLLGLTLGMIAFFPSRAI